MLLPLRDDNPTRRTPWLTYLLIAANTAVMVWLSTKGPEAYDRALVEHGFVPARIAQLSDPNLVVSVKVELDPAQQRDRRARPAAPPQLKTIELDPVGSQILVSIFSTMFLHAGWLHLLGNMWFLWIFGNNIEDRLGHVVYLFFYLTGGLIATACHWVYDPTSAIPVVGASGAVAAVLGGYAITYPKAAVKTLVFLGILTIIDIPALIWLGLWLGGQLLTALLIGKDIGVAVWAHIGGFFAGAIMMPLLSLGAPPPGTNWDEEIRKQFSLPNQEWK